MRIRVRNRWFLVLLVAGAQMVCYLSAVGWLANWLRDGLGAWLQKDVLAINKQVAAHVAHMIDLLNVSDLTMNSDGWNLVQGMIERTSLPNQGFLCIVCSLDGHVICHPEMRRRPELQSVHAGTATLHTGNGERPIIEAIRAGQADAGGWARMPDGGMHLVAVRDLPRLGVKLLAHQHQEGIQATIDQTVSRVKTDAWVLTVVMVAFGTVLTAVIIAGYENRLAGMNYTLEETVDRRTRALVRTRDSVIFGLAKLAESRDDETGEHLERIRAYVEILADQLSQSHPEIDNDVVKMLGLAASLHDIGKVGIPDSILLKPAKLSPEERAIIEKHPYIGGDCLLAIKQRLGEDDFLDTACEIVLAHHEKWDGTGYPYGLAGREIPFSARIVALADVYDAITSERVYKAAMPHEQARQIILDGTGNHFDPEVVRAFLSREDEFQKISSQPRTKIRRTALKPKDATTMAAV